MGKTTASFSDRIAWCQSFLYRLFKAIADCNDSLLSAWLDNTTHQMMGFLLKDKIVCNNFIHHSPIFRLIDVTDNFSAQTFNDFSARSIFFGYRINQSLMI